ncbi:uncharacterized protein THITE_2155132 [Thermothielavioides terrestris NRRL 8126]|uniref:DNA (cytosine-5-)-methyltransferase n=1 Tax=Thermothielavioides terrestris (strain ATCC 38088 / NRRL 8126) TaxID=578455 RepID=G2R7S3_THETT|nr:uncharacterized protein THITE_2155132 [Thermothielavioides terrestris NRRL 8126]AEO67982.1 hypothetical protein THITE_2155132 [Thermothielavioides terrestris NRRL 8126]
MKHPVPKGVFEPRRDFRDEEHEFPLLELPTDPAKLKALPTGFHDMTEVEQQEELWIVHAEDHMGREWQLPDPGKHKPYNHNYPPYSPSKVLGILYRFRLRRWTTREFQLARAIAGNRNLRLSVLTAQAFLRRHTLLARRRGVELQMERYLGSTQEWKLRLAELERKTGITEADIKQWLWILAPGNGDLKLHRFFKSNCRKPLFLLHVLVAKDKRIQEPAMFLRLLDYIRENYVLADRPQDELAHPRYKRQGRAMSWRHFLIFLYRLVWHCRETWPVAMPLLARLTADYIEKMPLECNARVLTGYQARSLVLNKALQYFSWPARVRPVDHMEHNWAAQRHLLRLAAMAEPPLVMDQNGYRAVRAVLIALSKTKGEARNAERAAKTWPPYRRTLDGIDERRDPEDDLSRSVKAGILVRAAGYNDDIVDRALSALGGSTFGQAPTIQTRSLPPPFFSGRLSSQNMYSEWASQVKATRNAREAWMVFQNPPEPGIRPDAQVYGEMFEKLYARPVTESPVIRPGDVKEVFPVYDGNLSEFEIARLTPPSPDELYDLMLMRDKVKPSGHCLVVLVKNARSKMEALRYLSDSPHEPYIQAFRQSVPNLDGTSLDKLSHLPPPVFNAWIAMLCRLHKRAPREASGRAEEISHGGSILEAIALTKSFQARDTKAAWRDKMPWHTIMQALAGRKMLYSRLGPEFNVFTTLKVFLQVYEQTTSSKGMDPVSFEALCIMIRKTLKLATFERTPDGNMVPRRSIVGSGLLEKLLVKAHRHAMKSFAYLVAPVPVVPGWDEALGLDPGRSVGERDDGVPPEMLRYNVVGRPLHRYMLALACCGNHNEMVRVMDWLFDGWDLEHIREEAKATHSLDYHYTMRTIAYFAEMGRELVDPAEMARLKQRLEDLRLHKGCTWFWPPEDDGQSQADFSMAVSAAWPFAGQGLDEGLPLPDYSLSVDGHYHEGAAERPILHPLLPVFDSWPVTDHADDAVEAQGIAAKSEFVEFELDAFCFYIDNSIYPCEMRPLQHMATRFGHDQFYFDGVLSIGGVKHYVQKIRVAELPIGNYGTSNATVQGQIWVRSELNKKREIYYRLTKPSSEYARFYTPFLWVADLAKHIVDYSAAMLERGRQVGLGSFESDFIRWLSETHGEASQFRHWRRKHPSDDYLGDTISTPRDGETTTDTKWRSMVSKGAVEDNRWFGLVQKVHVAGNGSRSFDVIWFYRPVETPCCMMKYPWPNELFLSDHCTCEDGAQVRVKEHEVLGIHNIDWFGGPNTGAGEFFVRQTYMVEGRRWVTLKNSHKTCSHDRQRLGFRTGDTVLAALADSAAFSEPYEVVKIFRQGAITFVRLRRLLRRRQIDPRSGAAPNELVYTDQLVVAKAAKVIGRCLVRFFRPGDTIPTPYDRGGAGNAFFITHELKEQDDGGEPRCVPFEGEFPTSLRQGFDPTRQTFRKLRGMDLFCGSGNFGRGLEEGGAVEMRWANDIWDTAIHTYMANTPNPSSTHPFLGSVDDLLRLALEGKYADNVPRPGEVDFISAGSPCPGFSLLTPDKTKLVQIKNQSLVASFASFVDFYRPKYGILENVITIVQARHNRSEDVLSQLFCAIVGLGYQAQLILGDAWSYGAPQGRSRVFFYFAAPGLRLPESPTPSHSHFPGVKARGLGEMCNGEPFVSRSFAPTPFKYVSAAEGMADLPYIGDGKAEPAIAVPDHRVCTGITPALRAQIAAIPTHPHGMNFVKTCNAGVMTPGDRALFPAGGFRVSQRSHGWGRVKPSDVLSTVTTRSQPTDARAGTGLHWHEDRPLTVQEVRRAQGFPDHEVLLGRVADQWKLVGNSVARQMALALGLKFREAWAGSLVEGGGGSSRMESREMSETKLNGGSSIRRRSTPRETTTDGVPAARHQQATSLVDLTSEPDQEAAQRPGPDTSRQFVDLTGASRSASPDFIETGSRSRTTPASAAYEPAKTGGARKRLMSQSLGPEAEDMRSPKALRLGHVESAPAPAPAPAPTPTPVPETSRHSSGPAPIHIAEAEAPSAPDRALDGEATPARTGPTIVRLDWPDEMEGDRLTVEDGEGSDWIRQ